MKIVYKGEIVVGGTMVSPAQEKRMADKRMFNRKVVESDAFLIMSDAAQNLYFHLCMNADDDGFIDNVSSVISHSRTNQKDLDVLIEQGFILRVSRFVYVIAHWFLHNNIQKDRYHPTIYKKEKNVLERPNNIWQFVEGESPYTEEDDPMDTEKRKEKDSKDKSKGRKRIDKNEGKKPYGEYKNVFLTDEEYQKLHEEFIDADARIEELSGAISQYGYKYESHYATIRNWARRKKKEQEQQPKSFGDIADSFDQPKWDIDL